MAHRVKYGGFVPPYWAVRFEFMFGSVRTIRAPLFKKFELAFKLLKDSSKAFPETTKSPVFPGGYSGRKSLPPLPADSIGLGVTEINIAVSRGLIGSIFESVT
jgi:hypothetical protein